jgi:FkbM family methyltransferase
MSKTCSPQCYTPPRDTSRDGSAARLRRFIIDSLFLRRGFSLKNWGDKGSGCEWTFCPDGLGPNSIVYSGGVGKNISFEHELVRNFNCTVHLLDPSPTGVATMQLEENRVPQLHFYPVALAGSRGTLRLSPPVSVEEGSWYLNNQSGTIEVSCTDLATLLKENNHPHVDLLKLDIEGAEFAVIGQIVRQKIPVKQIVVEFHAFLPGIRLTDAIRALLALWSRGYKLIAHVENNYTFLRAAH